MARGKSLTRSDDRNDVNISPMIDMVFILLIFFIVTTVFVEEQGLDADGQNQGDPLDKLVPVRLRLTSAGGVLIDSGENNALIDISMATVRSRVAERLRETPDLPVIVEVENDVPSGRLIQAIDNAKAAGTPTIRLTNAR